MEIKNRDYTIVSAENAISLEGKLEIFDYKNIADLLDKVNGEVGEDTINVDIKSLRFLNASGIRTLAVFFKKCGKKVEVTINPDIIWQKVCITPLSSICPAGDIVIV